MQNKTITLVLDDTAINKIVEFYSDYVVDNTNEYVLKQFKQEKVTITIYTSKKVVFQGENATYEDNVNKLLSVMEGIEDRTARFSTVITLSLDGNIYTFTGSVEGDITTSASGSEGFGYDPIFLPRESDRTFAQMTMEEKATISHRGRAFAAMIDFLKNYNTTQND